MQQHKKPQSLPRGDDTDVWFALEIQTETPVAPFGPDDDVIKFRVSVIPHDESSESEDEKPAMGHFDVWRFNIGAYTDRCGGDLVHLFDADSEEAATLFSWLFDEQDEFKKQLDLEVSSGFDILHFSEAEFPEEFRNSKLMLVAMARTIQVLGGGCAAATLWQWDKSKEAETSLGKIGFRKLPRTEILLRDLSCQVPMIAELLK